MRSRTKLKSGPFAVGFPAHRDEAVLDAAGIRVESVLYSFVSDAGAIGDVSFRRFLPAGAIVTRVFADELTNATSGGAATVTLAAGSTALTGATGFASFAGITSVALAGAVAGIKVAATSELKITIAGATLTAGKIRFYVEYLLPNDGNV